MSLTLSKNPVLSDGATLSRRGFLGITGAAGGTLFLLSACSTDSGTDAGGPVGDPVKGGTLTFAWLGFPEALDPHVNGSFAGVNLSQNTTDKLVWQDPETSEIGPWLATEWETNDDLTEYTFTLRDDVTFSDGTVFNAQSVKDNIEEYVKGNEALQVLPNGAPYLPAYKETVVVSDFVVKVVFSAPSASFLQFISYSGNYQLGFMGAKTLALPAADRLVPENFVSTGPFTITEYVEDQKVVIVRRDDYNWGPPGLGHDGAAYLDSIEFQTIPEASVRIGSLQSGDVDAAYDILPTDQTVLDKSGYTLVSRQIAGLNLGWHFNLSLAPTDDIAVRKAIVAATDRAGFKKSLLAASEGQAKGALADAVPGFVDYSDSALVFDLEAAKQLLEDAGWVEGDDGVREKGGQKLQLKATSNILVPNARVTYEATQAALKQIGIEVEIQFDVVNVPVDQINAEYHLINTNRSRNDAAVLNVAFNPELNNASQVPDDSPDRERIVATFAALESTLDPAERADLTKKALDLIHDELALYDPVFVPSQLAATRTVQGIELDATSRLVFLKTWLGE